MLFAAASEHEVDLSSSWMIGDSEKDVEAGRSAGCRTMRIVRAAAGADRGADAYARSLLEAVQQILQLEEASTDSKAPSVSIGVPFR